MILLHFSVFDRENCERVYEWLEHQESETRHEKCGKVEE